MAFDNDFDAAMNQVDAVIDDAFGWDVIVNASEPVKTIYREEMNEFDTMAGMQRTLSFRKANGIKPLKGDQIVQVSTGRTFTVKNGPYSDEDFWWVIV
jgi:hypothetical protein